MSLSICGENVSPQGKETIRHGTTLLPIACYEDALSKHSTPWHWHDEFEYIIVMKGCLELRVDGEQITLYSGDGIFINAGVLHAVKALATETLLHSAVFHPRLIGGSMDSIFWQQLVQPLLQETAFRSFRLKHDSPWQREMLHCFHIAWNAIATEAVDHENLARYQISRAIRLLNLHCTVISKKPSKQEQISSERIKTMLRFIEDHYAGEISVARIAESVSVSASVCLRCFHRFLGTTPIQYVKQLRIEKAAELLMKSNMNANEAGMECGFSDISYFTKTFREIKGCTPGEYRTSGGL